jgi:hypothetical protein
MSADLDAAQKCAVDAILKKNSKVTITVFGNNKFSKARLPNIFDVSHSRFKSGFFHSEVFTNAWL